MSLFREPLVCPACGYELVTRKRLFGLIRRYPSSCTECGTKLLYNTVGEVFVHEPPDAT